MPSRLLTGAIGVTFIVMLALPYIGPLAAVLAFVPLPFSELAIIIGTTALYLVVLDVVKVWYYRLAPPHPAGHARTTLAQPTTRNFQVCSSVRWHCGQRHAAWVEVFGHHGVMMRHANNQTNGENNCTPLRLALAY